MRRPPLLCDDLLGKSQALRRLADTFELEPLPRDHALRSLPNTVLTPHVGYVTEATYEVFYGDTVANISVLQ